METLAILVDFILHLDKHLAEIIQNYGAWTYLILFVIIFSETGFVFTPFLPGDSLLFVIGALGALGALNFQLILLILIIAAVGGNTLNYFIGRIVGHRLIKNKESRLIKKEHLDKTQAFYEKHGGKAIILSRFLPIFRTFAPFIAGIGRMDFIRFSLYNIAGGLSWVLAFMFGGYYFGNIPAVKDNFTYVVLGIIIVSLIPAVIAKLKSK